MNHFLFYFGDQVSVTLGLSPNPSLYQWVSEVVHVMNTLMKVQMKVVSMEIVVDKKPSGAKNLHIPEYNHTHPVQDSFHVIFCQ